MQEALDRRIPVVTSNKWPVALHGVELAELARSCSVAFRAESTVMSGTPSFGRWSTASRARCRYRCGVCSTPQQTSSFPGWPTASPTMTRSPTPRPKASRSATRRRHGGRRHRREGDDPVGACVRPAAPTRAGRLPRDHPYHSLPDRGGRRARGTTQARRDAGVLGAARSRGRRRRVQPELVDRADPLASIDGTTNAVVCRASPIEEVTIVGSGAGPRLAGQGVLGDLIGVARARS